MKSLIDQCKVVLQKSVAECESKWIALSGGLYSSILAHLLKDQKPQAMTIITKDFLQRAKISLSILNMKIIKNWHIKEK